MKEIMSVIVIHEYPVEHLRILEKIQENEDFIDCAELYFSEELGKDESLRKHLKELLKVWFSNVGPTAIDNGEVYWYDEEKDDIRNMSFVTVVS
jgi:hypothetical protein